MAALKPIVDYHGREVEVEIIYKSAGPFVYLDIGEEFARLTAGQARALAARLESTAAEIEGRPA